MPPCQALARRPCECFRRYHCLIAELGLRDDSSGHVASVPRIGALMKATAKTAQVRLNRQSPACWRVIFDNPPLNLMGPEFVLEFREIMAAIETDEQVKVVVFESAVEGFYLNHSDFHAKLEDLTSIPQGPTGLEAWPDILVRLTRAPVERSVGLSQLSSFLAESNNPS